MASLASVAKLITDLWPLTSLQAVKIDLDSLSDLSPDQLSKAVLAHRASPRGDKPPIPDQLRALSGKKTEKLDLPIPAGEDEARNRRWAQWFWTRLGVRLRSEGDAAGAEECSRQVSYIDRGMPPNAEDITWRQNWHSHLVAADRAARPERWADFDLHAQGASPIWDHGSALDSP